jgi:hypothetical protein
MTHAFTPEDTAEHLAGLQASADVIDALISESDGSNGERDMMDRNVRHIHIMCAMDHLKCCGTDLKPYTDAAARGSAWLAQN